MDTQPPRPRPAIRVGDSPAPGRLVLGVLLGGAVAAIVVLLTLPPGPAHAASFLAVTWAAAAVAWVGAVRARRDRPVVPLLIAGGLTASAVGDLTRHLLEWNGLATDVSVADVAGFSRYLGLGAALSLALMGARKDRRVDLDALIDVVTILTVSVLIFWSLVAQQHLAGVTASVPARVVWSAYPVADAVLLALALRIVTARRAGSRIGVPFALGLGCWLLADSGHALLPQSTTVVAWLGAGWMLGAALLARSAWPAPQARAREVEEPVVPSTNRWGIVMAIVPLVVPPALSLTRELRGLDPRPLDLVVGTTLLLAITFVRTGRLVGSERAARAEARKSRSYYAHLADSTSDAVVVVAADGRVMNHATQLERLVGGEGTTEGHHWLDLLEPVDRDRLEDLFSHAVAAPGEVFNTELLVGHDDDGEVWLSARLVNRLDDPDVQGVIVSLADISPRKRAESELARARDAAMEGSRMKSDFLATMSHEIRTPMNGVIGFTGLLLTTHLDDRQRQYAQGVRRAADAMLSLLNDILDLSKVEAGKIDLEYVDFNLVQIVEEAAELVAQTSRGKDLELLAYCSPELPHSVSGDPSRIRQVLLNLASNAVKFTDHGEVVIRAHLEDEVPHGVVVRFEVTDTGVGITEEDRERLFEPFSQADSSTTRRFGGTGLGLAISQRLATAMGGVLGVESEPGRGSTFSFTVPLGVSPDRADPAPAPSELLAGTRVLVVDDNQTNRLILSEQLGAWGMLPEVVADARTGLARLEDAANGREPYALALLDLCMPGMDGMQLARQVSDTPALSGTALVLLTSGPDVSLEEAKAAGFAARLTKPVYMSRLHTTLLHVLDESRREGAGAPTQATTPEPGSRGHVLVVDDNSTNQLVAVIILEQLGYSTEVAANGIEALAAVERSEFAAVLMDCRMPEMDGYEATMEVRRREGRTRHTPIIAMTAGVMPGDREACLEAGMDDYVAKPVSPQTLDGVLTRWVGATRT